MAEFLFEIGLEEIPARMIAEASKELSREVRDMLVSEQLIDGSAPNCKSFATPRRLALLVEGVQERQKDVTAELMGPAVKIAYKDGAVTPAAVAFAKKAGVEVSALKTVETPKGEYLAATTVRVGRTAAEVIAAEMPKILAGIYWAKNMYWRPGKPERFVRPVRWMVALLGAEVVPVSFGGYEAGAVTYGHRVLFGDEAISLTAPGEYEEALRKGFVIADVEVRRQKIRKAMDHVTRTVPGLRWREDHELVETVTQLTEWPSVLLGGFEKEYLALPEEVLVTVMRDHQKYFAVEDKDGRLAPHFLAVLNTEADEAGMAMIRHGNERVLRARFNDARFFWEFDQRMPLVERVKLLENVTFQKDLGSYAKKTERVLTLIRMMYTQLRGKVQIDESALEAAAQIAKTDLTTELVKEFTELQGIVGGRYAESQGLGELVGKIIYEQYKPGSATDSIPGTVEGSVFSLCDRLDTIVSLFSIGIEPTGSKDPFAIRRAANGVVKILAESNIPISFGFILTFSELMSAEPIASFAIQDKFKKFMYERLEFYLQDVRNYPYDVVKAVLAAKPPKISVSPDNVMATAMAVGEAEVDVRDITARADAITAIRKSEDFSAVCAAFKRMKNILIQASQGNQVIAREVRTGYFQHPAENALESQAGLAKEVVEDLRRARDYVRALEQIATLRPQVDAFFDAVMVMAPDAGVRANRLALLERVLGDFSGIADFSEIVVAG